MFLNNIKEKFVLMKQSKICASCKTISYNLFHAFLEFVIIIFITHLPFILLFFGSWLNPSEETALSAWEIANTFFQPKEIFSYLAALFASVFYIFSSKYIEYRNNEKTILQSLAILFFILTPFIYLLFYYPIYFHSSIEENINNTSNISYWTLTTALVIWAVSLYVRRSLEIEQGYPKTNADNMHSELNS